LVPIRNLKITALSDSIDVCPAMFGNVTHQPIELILFCNILDNL